MSHEERKIEQLKYEVLFSKLSSIEAKQDLIIHQNKHIMLLITDAINKLNANTQTLKEVLVDIQAGNGTASPELEAAINANSDQVSAIRAAVPVVPAVG